MMCRASVYRRTSLPALQWHELETGGHRRRSARDAVRLLARQRHAPPHRPCAYSSPVPPLHAGRFRHLRKRNARGSAAPRAQARGCVSRRRAGIVLPRRPWCGKNAPGCGRAESRRGGSMPVRLGEISAHDWPARKCRPRSVRSTSMLACRSRGLKELVATELAVCATATAPARQTRALRKTTRFRFDI